MKKAIIALAIILATLVMFGDSIEHSLNAFLLAGIIPGTSWQLPWYVTLLSTPILLYGVYRLLASLLAKDKAKKTAIIKKEAAKKATKNKSTKSKAKKSPAKPKKSAAKKKKPSKKSNASTSGLTRAQA